MEIKPDKNGTVPQYQATNRRSPESGSMGYTVEIIEILPDGSERRECIPLLDLSYSESDQLAGLIEMHLIDKRITYDPVDYLERNLKYQRSTVERAAGELATAKEKLAEMEKNLARLKPKKPGRKKDKFFREKPCQRYVDEMSQQAHYDKVQEEKCLTDEIIEEEEAKTPGFGGMVEKALIRRRKGRK